LRVSENKVLTKTVDHPIDKVTKTREIYVMRSFILCTLRNLLV